MRPLLRLSILLISFVALGILGIYAYPIDVTRPSLAASNTLTPLTNVSTIVGGASHFCVLTDANIVKCWGDNAFGELGDGTNSARSVVGAVVGLSESIRVITSGDHHSCVLTQTNKVYCWGFNREGQLGHNTTPYSNQPTQVNGFVSNITTIAAGHYHTCALITGIAYCWGLNNRGQLGDGTKTNNPTPTKVEGLNNVSALVGGYGHTCALTNGGAVYCWGDNAYGQLGDGKNLEHLTPQAVPGLGNVKQITAGVFHTCALTNDGSLFCWGRNNVGQLGIGNTDNRNTPTSVNGLGTVTTVASWADHTCAVNNTGKVYCWGNNNAGQLGDGSLINRLSPVQVNLQDSASVLVTGYGDTCALLVSGNVKCWGYNAFGQLGDGSILFNTTPTKVADAPNSRKIAAGGSHSCVINDTGGVSCWGYNAYGQLGDGTNTLRTRPTSIIGLGNNIQTIAAGDRHSCALTNVGALYCWGYNKDGQVGDGSTTDHNSPTAVTGLTSGVNTVIAGNSHTCALVSGATYCWGANGFGQLGDGSAITRTTPVQITALDSLGNLKQLVAGYAHTCALISESVYCWGRNDEGQLGDGTTTDHLTPTLVPGLSGVAAIDAGYSYTCALTTNSRVYCWGRNVEGQLGDGTTTRRTTPTQISSLNNVILIVAGKHHTCAIKNSANPTFCWGDNGSGQLGDGTRNNRTAPVPVTALASPITLAAGYEYTCTLVQATGAVNDVYCWGDDRYGQLGSGRTIENVIPVTVVEDTSPPATLGILYGVVQVTPGYKHTCALLRNGTVKCWGSNEFGQLGNSTNIPSTLPVDVSGLSNVTAIAAGDDHACALLTDHTVKCWGRNEYGQLGNAKTEHSNLPVTVDALTDATALANGGWLSCALVSGGSAKCWGFNGHRVIRDDGTPYYPTPVLINGLSGATAITMGGAHVCVIMSDSKVQCWGDNSRKQLGDGRDTDRSTPGPVVDLENVSKIAAGASHTCALLNNSTVKCWGSNGGMQLGDGTTTNQSIPVLVPGLSGVTALAAGGTLFAPSAGHTCARLNSGVLKCWGLNDVGQLGDGTTITRPIPVEVSGLNNVTGVGIGVKQTCALANNGLYCWGENDWGQLGHNEDNKTPHAVEDGQCYPLSFTPVNNGGSPQATPAQSSGCANGYYLGGETITLHANPSADWTVKAWSGADNGGAAATNVTTMPSFSHAVTVEYLQNCYTLTLTKSGEGSVPAATPVKSAGCVNQHDYVAGETITLNASPAQGWQVSGWTGTDNDNSPSTTVNLTMPADYRTATVIYAQTVAPWTAMIYLNGDNNLDPWTVQVFNRLESVANNPDLRICVLWDRKSSGDTRRYIVQHDNNPFKLAAYTPEVNLWERGELNMGDPQTLYDFMDWASKDCAAEHYFLAIVDHGGGWSPKLPDQFRQYARTGLSWDDTNDGAFLSTQDLGFVLRTFTANGHRKLDIVFYDACLMATIEDIYEVKDYVEYLVASENQAWTVFAYDKYLADISAATQPRDLTRKLVDTYDQQLKGYPRTMVGLNLSEIITVSTTVDMLAEQLGSVAGDHISEIRTAFNSAQKLDCNGDHQLTENDSCVDLYRFAQLLKQNVSDSTVQTAAQAVMDAMGEVGGSFIIAEKHNSGFILEGTYWNLDNVHGLSIYVPFGKIDWLHEYYNDSQLAFAHDTKWDEFLGIYLGECAATNNCPRQDGDPTPVPPDERIGPLSIEAIYLPLIMK